MAGLGSKRLELAFELCALRSF